jgi:hypothetical protein
LLRAGVVVFCVAIVMAASVLAVVIAHGPLLVRVVLMVLTAVCVLAGGGLVAAGTVRSSAACRISGWWPRIAPAPRGTPGRDDVP